MIDYDAWLREHEKQQQDRRNKLNTYDANWEQLRREQELPKTTATRGKTRTPVVRLWEDNASLCYYEFKGYGWEFQTRTVIVGSGEVYMTSLQTQFRDTFNTIRTMKPATQCEWATPFVKQTPDPTYQLLTWEGEYAVLDTTGTLYCETRRTPQPDKGYTEIGFATNKKTNRITMSELENRLDELYDT